MKGKKSGARWTVTERPGENPETRGQSRREDRRPEGDQRDAGRRQDQTKRDRERPRRDRGGEKSWSWRLRQRHGEVETREPARAGHRVTQRGFPDGDPRTERKVEPRELGGEGAPRPPPSSWTQGQP